MDSTCRVFSNIHGREEEKDNEDVDYADIIERNYLEVVTNLDLERQFIISYLRSKLVLDEEDCDLVRNRGDTRQQKVSIFLDIIKRKGSIGMKHFIDSLEYEHPQLYEQCTGKKATAGLADKELIDYDRVIFAKQLEQTASDLHWITRSLHKVQEEKNTAEKHLIEAYDKIQMLEDHNDELQEVIEKTATIKRLVDDNSLGNTEAIAQAQYLQLDIQQEIAQKANMLIALQGKLLAQTEEIDDIRRENAELKTSNDLFKKEITDLKVSCENERRSSKLLNGKILAKYDEMQQLHSCNELKRELEEFCKYSEILNAKYTMMHEEKCKLKEHEKEISFSFLSAKDQINELSVKCTVLECDNTYLLRNNKRYQNDIKTYSENQKLLHEERGRLMKERDEGWKAAETAQADLLKYKREHDEAIHNQMIINSALEEMYRDAMKRAEDMRVCFKQTKYEPMSTKNRTDSLEPEDAENTEKNGAVKAPQFVSPEVEPHCSKDESVPNFTFSYKKRNSKELLESIKRKLMKNDQPQNDVSQNDASENDASQSHASQNNAPHRKVVSKTRSSSQCLMTYHQIHLLFTEGSTVSDKSSTLPARCNVHGSMTFINQKTGDYSGIEPNIVCQEVDTVKESHSPRKRTTQVNRRRRFHSEPIMPAERKTQLVCGMII